MVAAHYRALCLILTLSILVQLTPTSPLVGVARAAPSIDNIAPDLLQAIRRDPTRAQPIIVEMRPLMAPFAAHSNEVLAQRALALLARFGRPIGALSLIAGAAGSANAIGITAIAQNPQVAFVYSDATVRAESTGPSPDALIAAYPWAADAVPVWQQGVDGSGVTVAVLDSGINADQDLTQPSQRILTAANFAGARGPTADGGGHGTHIAGTIAGNGAAGAGAYVGIAPAANTVDVGVLNSNGGGRLSSVIRGIEWVLAHREQYHIRVINLSLGTVPVTPYALDPLCAAVEIAWLHGIAVVVAAGNNGPSGSVDSPGIDPYVITVGATDDASTRDTRDDVLAPFSAWGTPLGSTPKPDVVAPGRRIVSLRVPGSTLDHLLTDRVTVAPNGATYFRLSGTSSATAVVSGVAALLLQQQPALRPDQVKAALTDNAHGVSTGAAPASADGHGLVDALRTVFASPRPAANVPYRPANTLARALYPVLYGMPLVWRDLHLGGRDWASLTWSTLTWDSLAWDNLAWDRVDWDNLAWDNLAWDNLAWDNLAWDNLAWDSGQWNDARID